VFRVFKGLKEVHLVGLDPKPLPESTAGWFATNADGCGDVIRAYYERKRLHLLSATASRVTKTAINPISSIWYYTKSNLGRMSSLPPASALLSILLCISLQEIFSARFQGESVNKPSSQSRHQRAGERALARQFSSYRETQSDEGSRSCDETNVCLAWEGVNEVEGRRFCEYFRILVFATRDIMPFEQLVRPS
jgi:hypothetical protein